MSSTSLDRCEDLFDEIWDAIVVTDSHVSTRFISHKRLKESLNRSRLKAILKCLCDTCARHAAESSEVVEERLSNWILTSAPKLFFLLGYNRCPQLIRTFFAKGCDDAKIEHDVQLLSASCIIHRFWPKKFRRLAESVEESRFKVFVPTLNDKAEKARHIQVFDAKTILPFTNEVKISYGTFGNVYGFELLEEYCDFKESNRHVPLVRKEIEEDHVFPEELPNLLHARSFNNPHIVRLITAYRHGNKLNLVFPRGTKTLQQFFREPVPPVLGISHFCIEQHPIWPQMLAVIEVLYQMYNEGYNASSGEQIRLYHFDLKPANIMVDETPNGLLFRVIDFGLSCARRSANQAGMSSKVTGIHGTAAYAPPEIESSDGRWNHRYDVWSLGCILLEVCAYVVGGLQEIKAFEASKFTQLPTQRSIHNDNIWQMSRTGELQIKPTVKSWIDRLPKTPNAGDKISAKFLTDVLELAIQMLHVNPSRRLDAEAAYHKLAATLDSVHRPESSASSYSNVESHYSEVSVGSGTLAGSVPVGRNELDGCQTMSFRSFDERHKGANASLFIDDRSVLRLELRVDCSRATIFELGPRRSLALIPSPALGQLDQNRLVVHLKHVENSHADSVRINFKSDLDTIVFQSVLMGQAVRSISNSRQKSLVLKGLCVEQLQGRIRPRLGSKGKSKILSQLCGTPIALQFWKEQNYVDPAAWAAIKPRKGSPRFVLEPPIRRLVIFCKKSLVTIRFGKNVRLKKTNNADVGWCHQLVPTDDTRLSNDPTFAVSVLTSTYQGQLTVPLDREELLALEEEAAYECSLVQLGFNTEQDWTAFCKRYKTLKEEWKRENDEIQKLKEGKAGERGWATNVTTI